MRFPSLLLVAAGVACAPAATSDPAATPASNSPVAEQRQEQQQQRAMVPPGHGTLRQDDITLSIRSGAVLVKVTPLDEGTIRMLAPDTYQRLTSLRTAREPEAQRAIPRDAELFLVSFFSYQPDVTFQPEDVQLMYQGGMLRPASIQPLTSGWGQQRLGQQETQTAVYAFEGPIEYDQEIALRYGTEQNDGWRTILTRIETERGKILARTR
ncbi:MAG TPA: hypothetical protein VK928_13845 [Longimicrobiales bacterium]|nr:hypothetical protein [Longimicrobiales bacterium]